ADALLHDRRPASPVDHPVDAAATAQALIGRVHDRVDGDRRDVAPHDLHRDAHMAENSPMPFAERAGVRIHYRDEGAGFPLVLHTGGAGDGTMWNGAGYTGRLGEFRLLVMDHRGRGQSSGVDDFAGHARGEYADDVVAVADAVGVERFAFAGYSMGAAIGYRLAAAYPDRVSTLV